LKKVQVPVTAQKLAPVDLLLGEVESEDEARQLDGVSHLGDMHDVRIVPALSGLLARTRSEQVVEAAVEALGKQKDPRAIPALRRAAQGSYDDFLKLSIARAQLALGDREGYAILVHILRSDEAGFARQQANELLEARAGRKFGYDAGLPVAQNAAALRRIEEWAAQEARK
jgi:HEAT repeat protein